MKTSYNQGFPKYARPKVEAAIREAEKFLAARYPAFDFSNAEVHFSITRHGSNYKQATQRINVCCRYDLYLYRKANAGLTTPPKGLNVGIQIQTACAIIHELTHYVQGTENRKFSEVETTQNEIKYLKQKDLFWYNQLIKC